MNYLTGTLSNIHRYHPGINIWSSPPVVISEPKWIMCKFGLLHNRGHAHELLSASSSAHSLFELPYESTVILDTKAPHGYYYRNWSKFDNQLLCLNTGWRSRTDSKTPMWKHCYTLRRMQPRFNYILIRILSDSLFHWNIRFHGNQMEVSFLINEYSDTHAFHWICFEIYVIIV